MYTFAAKQVVLRERLHSSLLIKIAKYKYPVLDANAMATTTIID